MVKCAWVVEPAEPGKPAKYCEARCSYKMGRDDDGQPVRVYDRFCPEHRDREEDDGE